MGRVWALRVLIAVATVVLGVATALFTVALHDYWWGLLLGLAATAATIVALPGGWARMPYGVAWSALVLLASERRPEGDFVISENTSGWILYCAALVVVIVSMIGARRWPAASDGGSDAPPSRERSRSR